MSFLHIFAIENQLPGFSLIGLPNVENFWNVDINVSIIWLFLLDIFMYVT